MKKAIFMLAEPVLSQVYPSDIREAIQKYYETEFDVFQADNSPQNRADDLKEVSAVFASWGAPKFTKELLDFMPQLEIIYYGAGTMKHLLTDEVWKRNIQVTTANSINAIPVAEYTLSQILFSLKNGWLNVRHYRGEKNFTFGQQLSLGAYRQTVGIISLSQIGRRVIDLLQPFDLNILYYDPYVDDNTDASINATKVSLKELFSQSQVVSLHSPLLPETEGMITGDLLASIPKYGTFINTARGAIVQQDQLIHVLQSRPDLTAILDVTEPEPLEKDSPLFVLSNAVITPHIAGSLGSEIARMGQTMADEAQRFVNDEPLKHEITESSYRIMA